MICVLKANQKKNIYWKRFPDEFTHGKDKTVLKGLNLKAKANAAQTVGELIQIAENKSVSEDMKIKKDNLISLRIEIKNTQISTHLLLS